MFNEFLIDNLSILSKIEVPPKRLDDIIAFFKKLKKGIEDNERRFVLLGLIFYKFLTNKEMRLDSTSGIIFEKIMAGIFKGKVIGHKAVKINDEKKGDKTLKTNKIFKPDVDFDGYKVSLKTLKGKLFNINLLCEDKKYKYELSIGAVSITALLKGTGINDEDLTERKRLGSRKKLIANLYDPLMKNKKMDIFLKNFEDIFMSIYGNIDIIVLFKRGYQMKVLFFHGKDFVESLLKIGKEEKGEKLFKVLNRWEGGSIRLSYTDLFEQMKQDKKLEEIVINLNTVEKNKEINERVKEIQKNIRNFLSDISK
ncbi:hypothetical protein IX317_001158 [Fusobacterium sp. DD29]|uniref:hypothetical protein n=1 Tax=unclassified Fusobacterium TaxID=2648384 RepID=UPI001B8C9551|nr:MULTISPECIES: hypothetical protein [unclassified Fusobacterium]MBR8701909.1 hypothetical protein [Fusobacterium sp. DD45]MBR8711697.1 hypothetical protein [Fusobacterium sp. DD28]MBR8749484.1 hypothetical protein [Fusobacterium sp. DD29]MBR8752246.1 hypothetical protein [Fusobacterium sp. DD26]MBR8761723.1 hypothetical protein [Fusobacterium sp. DD25]